MAEKSEILHYKEIVVQQLRVTHNNALNYRAMLDP